MGKVTYSYLALLSGFILTLSVYAQDQSGFISLDCGQPANSSYDKNTGLYYTSDATYIDTGISKSISPEFKTNNDFEQLWNVRSFPEGTRNCYHIKLKQGNIYLIRGTFAYGNYDSQGKLPEFDLHIGANMWDSVKLDDPSTIVRKEIIHVPSSNYVHVCLVNTGYGTPFISALELRPLPNDTYETESGSLALYKRTDTGSIDNQAFVRFEDDIYDRIWSPDNPFDPWTSLSTLQTINSDGNDYQPPSKVMTTAATPVNISGPLIIVWDFADTTSQYYFYMYFAEVEELQANQSRSFNIFMNGEYFVSDPVLPDYLSTTTVYSAHSENGGKYELLINKTKNSTLPPILNAIEVYRLIELLHSETDQEDVSAITTIKSIYDVKKNWQGDPCAPQEFSWEGLNCTYDSPPRIVSLNLSSSGLTGEINHSIFNLKMIQTLDLSNNNLTGPLPDFLSQLPSLRVLNLERNQLTGSVPTELLEKSKKGSLSLSVGGNPNLCSSVSCKKKKNNIIVPVVASVGGLCILLLTAAAIFWSLKRRKRKQQGNKMQLESREREFTFSDVQQITNNFQRILGKGGFGTVYHGYINKTQVAVKMLSPSSIQGYQQFHAEVSLLVRVHHRNLTTFIGYCNEGTNIGLIYEYMANRDLSSHLSGGKANILRWEDRLRIGLDAAQGLEYLHNGCKPPIIHRDVKSTNILLNESLHAKLADFGLSKAFPTDGGTHLSTIAAGTPGYLDPEYYIKNWLTEKSDVYSFGVVLLEIITSQPVIAKNQEKTHISQWVSFMLAKGDINNIVDPKLRGYFEINSVWKAVEVAMACVSHTSIKRPTMSQVVVELKECLSIELSRTKQGHEAEWRDSVDLISVNLNSELSPSAR